MAYLIDTNVISEVRKRERCDARVSKWYASVVSDELFLSVLVLGEVQLGIERVGHDRGKAAALRAWLKAVRTGFRGRILPITVEVAKRWGVMNAKRPFPVIDGLLAATAMVHDLTLVTRNTKDLDGCGAALLNPWHSTPAA